MLTTCSMWLIGILLRSMRTRVLGSMISTASFDLDSYNTEPAGILYANNLFYVVDDADDKVYVYTSSGQRDSNADFDLGRNNTDPADITYVNNLFYVADQDGKVYAYTSSGQRDITSDFGLEATRFETY